ncbi:MAG: 1,2-phenylacetyl-CoA epoxidase subunit PaaD [Sporichthyaceae bacterium]
MVSAVKVGAGEIRAAVEGVLDPELPVITIADLGVLRAVEVTAVGMRVTITPTYSGCPAMDAIRDGIRAAVLAVGGVEPEIVTVLAPAWSTDWITEAGRAALAEHGIAPPPPVGAPVAIALSVRCPQCGSLDTRQRSRFSGTACKAMHACQSCREPFEAVKAI